MTERIKDAIRVICSADASISESQVNAAIAELEGNGKTLPIDTTVNDRVLSHKQTAALLHVTPTSVREYARRGLLKKVCFGIKGVRANGYTESSVRKLIEGGKTGGVENA